MFPYEILFTKYFIRKFLRLLMPGNHNQGYMFIIRVYTEAPTAADADGLTDKVISTIKK